MLAGPDVAADAVDLLRRHEETVAVGVLQLQVLALALADGAPHEAGELRDAVLDVHDVLARRQVGEERFARRAAARRRASLLREAEDLGVGEQRDAGALLADGPAVRQRAVDDRQPTVPEVGRLDRLRELREDVVLLEQLGQAMSLRRHDDDLLATAQRLRQLVSEHAQTAAVRGGRAEGQAHRWRRVAAFRLAGGPA